MYVYFILANDIQDTAEKTSFTNVSLVIDGETVTSFSHLPSADGPDYIYRVPGLHRENLSEVSHTIQIISEGPKRILVLFDYLIYTYTYGIFDPIVWRIILTILSSNRSEISSEPSASAPLDSTTVEDRSSSISQTVVTLPNKTPRVITSYALSESSTMTPIATLAQSNNSGIANGPSESGQGLSSSSDIDTIVGGVIGASAFIALAVIFFCVTHRRRRRQKESSSPADSSSFVNHTGIDKLIPHSSRSSFEKDPYPHTSFRPSEAAVDDRPISLDKKGSWNKQDSLPPSIYGYGVGLNSPSVKKKGIHDGSNPARTLIRWHERLIRMFSWKNNKR